MGFLPSTYQGLEIMLPLSLCCVAMSWCTSRFNFLHGNRDVSYHSWYLEIFQLSCKRGQTRTSRPSVWLYVDPAVCQTPCATWGVIWMILIRKRSRIRWGLWFDHICFHPLNIGEMIRWVVQPPTSKGENPRCRWLQQKHRKSRCRNLGSLISGGTYTFHEINSSPSPLKIGRNPIGKDRIPIHPFLGAI